jgi:hypothetical protein
VDANEQTAGMVEACLYGSSILDIPTHELAMKPEGVACTRFRRHRVRCF